MYFFSFVLRLFIPTDLPNENVFAGKGWEHHRDGQLLKADGESFKAKLNTTELFDDWARKVQQKEVLTFGRIFNIEPTRARIATKDGETQTVTVLKLKVNFQLEVITLAKEVRKNALNSVKLFHFTRQPFNPFCTSSALNAFMGFHKHFVVKLSARKIV